MFGIVAYRRASGSVPPSAGGRARPAPAGAGNSHGSGEPRAPSTRVIRSSAIRFT